MMAEKKRLEELLKSYKKETDIGLDKDRLEQTIRLSKNAFYRNEQKQTASYMEFLIQQGAYIRKRWWFLQFLTLILLWWIMYSAEGNYYVERSMGVFAPVFVILLIPEFWKNRSSGSEEVEGAAFYSLRQVYSARMLLFGMADFFLLSLFCGAVSATVQLTAEDLLIQFFLPFNVTCCICFSVLCCRRYGSEYMAVALSLLWIAVWILIVLNEAVYNAVARPVWWLMLLVSVSYMACMIFCFLRSCRNDQEGNISWS